MNRWFVSVLLLWVGCDRISVQVADSEAAERRSTVFPVDTTDIGSSAGEPVDLLLAALAVVTTDPVNGLCADSTTVWVLFDDTVGTYDTVDNVVDLGDDTDVTNTEALAVIGSDLYLVTGNGCVHQRPADDDDDDWTEVEGGCDSGRPDEVEAMARLDDTHLVFGTRGTLGIDATLWVATLDGGEVVDPTPTVALHHPCALDPVARSLTDLVQGADGSWYASAAMDPDLPDGPFESCIYRFGLQFDAGANTLAVVEPPDVVGTVADDKIEGLAFAADTLLTGTDNERTGSVAAYPSP